MPVGLHRKRALILGSAVGAESVHDGRQAAVVGPVELHAVCVDDRSAGVSPKCNDLDGGAVGEAVVDKSLVEGQQSLLRKIQSAWGGRRGCSHVAGPTHGTRDVDKVDQVYWRPLILDDGKQDEGKPDDVAPD